MCHIYVCVCVYYIYINIHIKDIGIKRITQLFILDYQLIWLMSYGNKYIPNKKNIKISWWWWWQVPVVQVTREAEAGALLEPRR